ncbi:MAG: hypothetical protein WC749_02115 [Dehalococcoidia bacterium]
MSPFFDQPGSSAGPYSTPPQQGIFSKILQGVDVALKLGDFYQNWQAKSQAQKTGALKGIADRIGLIQTLNPEGAAAPADLASEAEKVGVPLPKITAATQQGMAARFLPAPAPLTAGGLTRPNDPDQLARQATMAQGMAELPAVGTAMIPAARPKTLEEILVRKMAGGQSGDLTQAIGMYNSIKHPGVASTAEYHNKMLGLKEREVGIKEKEPGWKEKTNYKESLIRGREGQTVDIIHPETGQVVGKARKGSKFQPRPEKMSFDKESYLEAKKKEPGLTMEQYQVRVAQGKKDQTQIITTVDEADLPGGRGSRKTIRKERVESQGAAGTQVIPPTKHGGPYYSEDGQHFKWNGTKYVPYTGQ